MLKYRHIHQKSNTTNTNTSTNKNNKLKNITLKDSNSSKKINFKSKLINSSKKDNKFLGHSLVLDENRTKHKIKPLLIPEKKIKYNSQVKRTLNKNIISNKQKQLNLSADKRKINDKIKINNVIKTQTKQKSNDLKIKKFIYNKKLDNNNGEKHKKKNNGGNNLLLSKTGNNFCPATDKKLIINKNDKNIKEDKKKTIKNKINFASKSIEKQKTLNIVKNTILPIQKRLFSKKKSSEKDKSDFNILHGKNQLKKNNINHNKKLSNLSPSSSIENSSESDSDSNYKYKRNITDMKYTLNKKEKIKNSNKNINSEIKIVEFKNNKYLRRRSVDNPTERDKIEQYLNKILLKNNGGNSLFLKNYEGGPILETDINFLVGNEKINRKIKISSCTKAGLSGPGIVKKNQDSYFIKENFMSNPDYFFLGVCDGHGDDGESISNLVANKLQNYITSLSNEEIISNFKKINSEIYSNSDINSDMSGTTVVSLIITPEKLISINLGDSRLTLFKYDNEIYYSKNLSREHKPVELDESERIISGGGRLQKCFDKKTNKFFGPQRIWLKNEEQPGLAMTRSIGDKIAHNIGVIEEPEIKKFLYDGSEKFIIIASDGLWEYINGEQCINIVKKIYEEEKDAKKAAFELTKEAFKKWKRKEVVIDDITVIVIFFY